MKLPFAFVLFICSVSVHANNVCERIAKGDKQGKSWSIIDIPFNMPSPREQQKFLSVDIDNDGVTEEVARFAGGTQQVPYLKILKGDREKGFGSDRCGGGSPGLMSIVNINNKNYIHVSIIKIAQKDCGITGYITELKPNDYFGKEYCAAPLPNKKINKDT